MLNVQPTFRILIPVFLTCLLFTTGVLAIPQFLTFSADVESTPDLSGCFCDQAFCLSTAPDITMNRGVG